MGRRRSSFTRALAQHQREIGRQRRLAEREDMRAVREAERARRAYERAAAAEEKERKRLYLESRIAEVDALNEELDALVAELETLLDATLNVDDFLDFEALKAQPEVPPFQPGALAKSDPPPVIESFLPQDLGGFGKLMPGAKAKHEAAVEDAKAAFKAAQQAHREKVAEREHALSEARAEHDSEVAGIRARAEAANREIDEFRSRFEAGDPDAVTEYFSLVLSASSYPEGFPQRARIAFVPESRQLVVEYEFPPVSVVPGVRQYKYVRTRDAIDDLTRPAAQVRTLYAQAIGQTTLRTIHELFEADRADRLESIVFNGFVNTIEPATGQPAKPHLVTVRTSKEAFTRLDLSGRPARVPPRPECVRLEEAD